ncbi:MAG: glycosyltransferase family 1 protein [Nitratireductor sp.]|nr:glycosyltransferase family 1 protein [Nitratireductor sp.]
MRILIVTDAWHPQVNGVVRTWVSLITELKARGHRVWTITPDRFRSLPLPTYPEIRLALTASPCLSRRMQRIAPDAVHIATEGPLGIAARAACLKLGWPFSTSYHTRFPEYLNARLPVPLAWTYAWLRRFHNAGRGCLVATPSMAAELEGNGFNRLVTWTRGVDRDLFSPQRRDPEGELKALPRPVFLNVGRVAVEKNLNAFLELDLPGSKVVVGDGPDLARLKAAFPDAVFLGMRTGESLAALYASADVFVFPSLTDTFGNVITEALASGLPVAAFPVPGPRDILTDRRAGILDRDLGRACLAALGLDGRDARHLSGRYTWRECADIFLGVIEQNRIGTATATGSRRTVSRMAQKG